MSYPLAPPIALSAASNSSALLEYQLVANGPWFVGQTSANSAGAVSVRDLAGAPITPFATRLTGGSIDQGRQAIGVSNLRPVQHLMSLGFTVPSVGSILSITVTPGPATTASQYLVGDLVIVAEPAIDGSSQKLARAIVTSVSGDTINLQITARDAATIANPTFNANSEITGQTRLGAGPVGTTGATIVLSAPPELTQAANNPDDVGHAVATLLQGLPIAFWGFKIAPNLDIDLSNRMGEGAMAGAEISLTSPADIAAWRLVSATSLSWRAAIEITYTKAV
jgi:hypothetical protein